MTKKNHQKTQTPWGKLRLKVGLACVVAAVFSMAAVSLTSLDDIFFPLTFVLMFCGIVLVFSSGKLRRGKLNFIYPTNWAQEYSKNPLDPRNPFYRSRHR